MVRSCWLPLEEASCCLVREEEHLIDGFGETVLAASPSPPAAVAVVKKQQARGAEERAQQEPRVGKGRSSVEHTCLPRGL